MAAACYTLDKTSRLSKGVFMTASLAIPVPSSTDAAGQKLRILMIAPQPFFRARGTPFSVLHRIRALCEAGHTVDLVTYPFGADVDIPGLQIIRSPKPPFIGDVKIGPSVGKLVLDLPLYLKSRRLLRRRRYDILHSHEEAAFFSVHLARRHGIQHVYDMHSSLPQQLQTFKAFDLKPIRSVFERLENHVLDTCDGVITICRELEVVATARCGDTPHAMIENTGDDTKIFGVSDDEPRRDLQLDDRQIILYTGTFETYQGLDLLLEAMVRLASSHRRAHLLMVGGRPTQVEEYRQKAASLSIADRVTFVGTVHPLRIPAFLKAADVIASPRSRGTNTPLKIYGYMRSRRPVVATNLHTHTQTLTPEIACLVPATAEGFAEGLARVLDDRDYAENLARNSFARAQEYYSDETYMAQVTDFYEAVLARRTPAHSPALALT